MRRLAAVLVLALALGALAGCGRKGKLQPPPESALAPPAVAAPTDAPA